MSVLQEDELDALIYLQEMDITGGLMSLTIEDAKLAEIRVAQREAAEEAAINGDNIEIARMRAGERVVLKFLAFSEKKTWI